MNRLTLATATELHQAKRLSQAYRLEWSSGVSISFADFDEAVDAALDVNQRFDINIDGVIRDARGDVVGRIEETRGAR